jgi:hypothetical protein
MRFFLLIVFITTFFVSVSGQDSNNSIELSDTLTDEEKVIMEKRSMANDFSHTLHKIGDPSIASFGFSDYTYNSVPSRQKKPFILNASIQPIIGIGGKRWYVGNFVHTFQVIPSITVRIFENDSSFNDHSLPVRTPSFVARFNYFFSHAKLWNDSSRVKIYFGASFFHHSNGQDGYEFNSDGSINTYNGNFSELAVFEYMTGGMRIIKKPLQPINRRLVEKGSRKIQVASWDKLLYWKLAFENHPQAFTTPRFLEYNLYGRNRVNIQLGYLLNPLSRHVAYSKRKEKWVPVENSFHKREIRRVVFNLSYIIDRNYNTSSIYALEPVKFMNVSKRLNADLTWYERIGTSNDYAVFVRVGYYGSDPYNIYFQESIFIARFGIAFGNFVVGERK